MEMCIPAIGVSMVCVYGHGGVLQCTAVLCTGTWYMVHDHTYSEYYWYPLLEVHLASLLGATVDVSPTSGGWTHCTHAMAW